MEKSYTAEYDSRKAAFEYAIPKHAKVGSYYLDEVIVAYARHMNRWFNELHWRFDGASMLFEEN